MYEEGRERDQKDNQKLLDSFFLFSLDFNQRRRDKKVFFELIVQFFEYFDNIEHGFNAFPIHVVYYSFEHHLNRILGLDKEKERFE